MRQKEVKTINTKIIAVYGGSGSGKTTFAMKIVKKLGSAQSALISSDWYYKDLSCLSSEKRKLINFDKPQAMDIPLLVKHLKRLRTGGSVECPIYNFKTHTRKKIGQVVASKEFVVVEGMLFLTEKRIRDLFDFKIFIDADDDVRFIRRLKRDIKERGRTQDSVVRQHLSSVKPMHDKFIVPTRKYADQVVHLNIFDFSAVNTVCKSIRKL